MDTLTHLLVGHAMGAAASSMAGPHGAVAYWGAFIGNSLPDLDVPVSFLLGRGIKLHRTITHTVPGCIAMALVNALVLHQLLPGAPLGVTFVWTLLGCLVHLGMDCLNLFGARPFWPVSPVSVDLGVLHILDPILVALLGAPAVGVALHRTSPAMLGASFWLMLPYVAYRIVAANRLYRKLKREGSIRARIIPWYAGWRYVFETEEEIEYGFWKGGRRRVMQRYPKANSPLIRSTLADPQVSAFLQSAEYPYAEVQEDENGLAVVWGDALRQLRADFRPLRVHIGT